MAQRPAFRGRAHECEALDRLLHEARRGRSAVLVIQGEAGVGKTSLLEHCIGRASDFRVTRVTGLQSELELPFAALIGLAFLAYQRGRMLLMTTLVAISPLARPEGFGFIALAAVALIAQRRWWMIAVLAIPLLVWDYVGWRSFGSHR